MSLEVFRYLSDSGGNFTENLPTSQRPPVPGEENDNLSNDGKSQCSKSGESSGGGTVRNEKSPVATPRRSNLYPNTPDPNKKLPMSDDEAPLGFEPEGSASVTPPYTRWTESLHALLADDDGIRLFQQFLSQEKAQDPLLFWLATEGFKKKSADDPKRTELAKVIYRRFVKVGGQQAVKISLANRTLIEESVRKGSFDHTLFDLAQGEVEESIRETTYPLFLKSDLYVQYINNGGISPKSSEDSSSSGNSRLPGFLPTLPEDAELTDIPRDELADLSKPVPLTSEMLMATSCYRSSGSYNSREQEGHYLKGSTGRLMNPYHASYAAFAPAASANDSELQSLSSDAISDDTMSLTDSSVDGVPISRHSRQTQRRRQHRAMKTNIRQNGKVASFPPFPHMQRPQKEVQHMEPNEFARILTEKLERVVHERESQERLAARLKEVEESECEADISSSSMATEGAPVLSSFSSSGNMVEDDPNSILDEHCSRVFVDSARHSPGGNFSPSRSKSPDRARRAKSAGSIPGMPQMPPGYTKQMLHKQRSRSKDALARDSGFPQDYIDMDMDKYTHKYHHHYYPQKSKHQIEMDATRRSMTAYALDGTEPSYNKYCAHSDTGVSSYPYDVYVDTGKYKKGKSSSKKSDTSSISKTTDSGIYEGPPSLPSDSEKTKSIEQWIRQGETFTYSQKKGPSRGREQQHKRTAHRLTGELQMSSSLSPHRPQHTTSKRTTLAYNTSRPTSVERPYTPTNPLHIHSKRSVPSQPIMQDPCMPPNPPPDSMAVLEEVRRRIESSSKQQKLRHQEASRSKERKPSSNSSNQGTLRVTSAPVKMSATSPDNPDMQLPGSSASNTGKKTSSSSSSSSSKNRHSAPAGSEQKTTVTVAYYFCNDPIPYRTTLAGDKVTLAQFKALISKKGNYRYTFKTPSDEFDTGVVHEIISDENAILPIFQGKIIGKVEKMD